jgi:hypothetical protein
MARPARHLNGFAADALRIVAAGLERLRLGIWWLIGWLDAGRP